MFETLPELYRFILDAEVFLRETATPRLGKALGKSVEFILRDPIPSHGLPVEVRWGNSGGMTEWFLPFDRSKWEEALSELVVIFEWYEQKYPPVVVEKSA